MAAQYGQMFYGMSNIGGLIFRVWGVVGITFILVFMTGLGAVNDSIQQRSFAPFFRKMGGELINHDNKLFASAASIEKAGGLLISVGSDGPGFIDKLKFYWEVFKNFARIAINFWYLYVFAFLFYKLSVLITNNSSAVFSNIVLVLLFLSVFQILANMIIIEDSILEVDGEPIEFTMSQKFMPFKGLIKFIKVLPLITNPIYDGDVVGSSPIIYPAVIDVA